MLKFFVVSGKFLVGQTRKSATLSPVRVFARDVRHAAAQVAGLVGQAATKQTRAKEPVVVTADFCLRHLRIVETTPMEAILHSRPFDQGDPREVLDLVSQAAE